MAKEPSKINAATEVESPQTARGRGFRIAEIAVFLLIAGVYLGTLLSFFPGLPIIERAPLDIPGFMDHYPPFRVDENVYHDISLHVLDGTLYRAPDAPERAFPAGFPVIAAPFVALFGAMGGYVANLLIILVSLFVMYLILRRYGLRKRALTLTLVGAFASLEWFYAVSNYSEPLAQLLAMLALFYTTGNRDSKRRIAALAAAGLCTGLLLFVRPHTVLVALPFLAYLGIRKGERGLAFDRRVLPYIGGGTAVLVLWAVRNVLVFGSPLAFEYSRLVGSFAPGMASNYMQGNMFLGIHRLFFDNYHGLFTITPVYLLFPAGLRSMWNRGLRGESLMLFGAASLVALFVASGPYPFTEFGLGSRHMVPVALIFLIPIAFFLDGRFFTTTVVTVVALSSFYQAGIGWFTGGEPGMGFFIGILNEAQARSIILARKGLLPKKHFRTREDLVRSFNHALDRANMRELLQVLDPEVVDKINGHERDFMIFLRNQADRDAAILSADPARGIVIRSFSVSGGFEDTGAPPEGEKAPQ